MSVDIENERSNVEETSLKQQYEIEFYKKENTLLQQEINKLIEENRRRCSDEDSKAEREQTGLLKYKKCTDDVIQNLQDQITSLTEEITTHKQLWSIGQHTIDYLEREIGVYLKQSNNPNLVSQLKAECESSLKMLKNENEQLKSSAMALQHSKQMCEQQLQVLDKKHNDLIVEHKQVIQQLANAEQVARANRAQLATLKSERDEFEKQFRSLSETHSQCQIRESMHFAKVLESVNVAEAAIKERTAAVEREKETQEECDRLASTIGRVMQEAGDRVDSNMTELKREYTEKLQKMEALLRKVTISNDIESKNSEAVREQFAALEQKLEEMVKANDELNRELQVASKTIVELEMKIDAYEKLLSREQETTEQSEERSKQLQSFIESNKRLKQKWKDTFDEMTEHLQAQLTTIHKENAILLIENQRLNAALAKASIKKS